MYKAALPGADRGGTYAGPDRRWTGAVLAWLDWQLKGDAKAATKLKRLSQEGWTGVAVTGLE
jgi:hypothetical protein